MRSPSEVLYRVNVALLARADRLFGEQASDAGPRRRWLLRYLGVATILVAIIIARRPDAVTNPQFWAEDGYVYFFENLTLGFVHALSKFYNGYPNLTQRMIALVGGWVPFEAAPQVYTASAMGLTALALASFSLPGFRHLVRSDALRAGFGIAAVSAPFGQEVLSTPTNLGWFLAIWLALLSVMRFPRRWSQVVALALAGCAAIFSTPLAAVSLPLWLLRAWRGARRRDRVDLAIGVTLLAALVLVVTLTRNLGAYQSSEIRRGAAFDGLSFLGMTSYWWVALALGPHRLTDMQMVVVGAVALAGLTWVGVRQRARRLPGLPVALYYFVGSFFCLLLGRPLWFSVMSLWWTLASRYLVFPSAMLVLATVALLDGMRTAFARRMATAAVVAFTVWSWGPDFVIEPFVDQRWPEHAALLEQKLQLKSLAPLVIPMNPPWAPLEFDPVVLSTEIKVPPTTIVGALGTHGGFRQSFICRCNRLRNVDLMLAASAWSSRGSLTMSLIQEPGTRVVARGQIPRDQITPEATWQSFIFDPIPDSAGQRYTIVLRAVDNELEATILVLGANGDPYPEGSAVFSSWPINGDATFRYGCIPPGR
jgi:hypothetical protein